jgi:DNA repair exonuclease SbcCD ATPase subunit
MTKQELQKELKEKVKPGVKPSQLKRSRSAGDIPKAPPLPKPLVKSKSADMIMRQQLEPSSSKVEQLETKISVLELKLETQKRELTEKDTEYKTRKQILSDQLKLKQQEVESLREQLEKAPNPNLLDQSLIARHQNLKDIGKLREQKQALVTELDSTIEESSEELISQDQTIANLRTANLKLKTANSQLTQDLHLTRRLIKLHHNSPFPDLPYQSLTYLKYALYTSLAL